MRLLFPSLSSSEREASRSRTIARSRSLVIPFTSAVAYGASSRPEGKARARSTAVALYRGNRRSHCTGRATVSPMSFRE